MKINDSRFKAGVSREKGHPNNNLKDKHNKSSTVGGLFLFQSKRKGETFLYHNFKMNTVYKAICVKLPV